MDTTHAPAEVLDDEVDDAIWLLKNPVYTLNTQEKVLRFARARRDIAYASGDLAAAVHIQAFETRELMEKLTFLAYRDELTIDGASAIELLHHSGDLSACYGEDLKDMPQHVFDEIWRSHTSYAAKATEVTLSPIKAIVNLVSIADRRGWPDDSLMRARFAGAWANLAARTPGGPRPDGSISGYMGIVVLPKLPDEIRKSAVKFLAERAH